MINNKNENRKDFKLQDLDFVAAILLAIGLLLVFLLPWFIAESHCCWNNLKSSSEIGDAIGGITSPVIGSISAVLLYLAFREQRDANRKVQIQINNDETQRKFEANAQRFKEYYAFLGQCLNDFTFLSAPIRNNEKEGEFYNRAFNGVEAFDSYWVFLVANSGKTSADLIHAETLESLSKESQYYYRILFMFLDLMYFVEKEAFHKFDKNYFIMLLSIYYKQVLKIDEKRNLSFALCPVCNRYHGLVPILLERKLNEITLKIIDLRMVQYDESILDNKG
ncbi:MAG: hypothetical protein ACK5XN_03955 [Bacteroidota bacterium]|jgi:hypothetical protein